MPFMGIYLLLSFLSVSSSAVHITRRKLVIDLPLNGKLPLTRYPTGTWGTELPIILCRSASQSTALIKVGTCAP